MEVIIILSIAGIIISIYGIMVEKNIARNHQYQASCDLSDTVSCSRAFLSPYSKVVGISNIWAAFIYYCGMLAISLLHIPYFLFVFSCLGLVASLVFAYILYFKICTVCLICTSLYIINIACVFVAYSLLPLQ